MKDLKYWNLKYVTSINLKKLDRIDSRLLKI